MGDRIAACKGCDYYRRIGDAYTTYACHYALVNGRCRSSICPPGEKCTVRSVKGVKAPFIPDHKYSVQPRNCRASQFEELYNQGFNDHQIANELGCSNSTVFAWRKRTGRSSNYKEKIKKNQQERIEMESRAVKPVEDPCLKCRSKVVCEAHKGTCNEKERWAGDF